MRGVKVQYPGRLQRLSCCCIGILLLLVSGAPAADDNGKTIFLVKEDGLITAVNAGTGQFFDLEMRAKEVVQKHAVASGVAVVATNQRFAGIGAWPSGWSDTRRLAGERLVSIQAEDYSAVVVTSDRVLSFNGRSGAWAEKRR